MIGIVRDTWRAVLVVATVALVREMVSAPPPPPIVATPTWQPMPQPVFVQPQQPARPLRRVASAMTELADSVIGVVR